MILTGTYSIILFGTMWYYILCVSIMKPFSHLSPDQPGGHIHTPVIKQDPPFWQLGTHSAV